MTRILISSTEYAIVVDTEETTLDEWMICLEQQYPEGGIFDDFNVKFDKKK